MSPSIAEAKGATMASLDSVSITILFGAVLVLAGIMSSLIALRFGAPLLLIFLLIGMLAGESGIGGIKFDDVRLAYTVGSVALGLILFDGGLRTRLATFRNVLLAGWAAGDCWRARHRDADSAGRRLGARTDLERSAAGRRRDGLDRRRRGVLPAPRQGPAASPPRLARRSRSNPASTTRSRSSSPSSWSRSCSPATSPGARSQACWP